MVFDPGQLLQQFNRDLEAMGQELINLLDQTGRTGAESIRGNLDRAAQNADRTRIQIESALLRLGRLRPQEFFIHGEAGLDELVKEGPEFLRRARGLP